MAPISHAGELLGVIVIARAEGAVGFREEDDRVLTELGAPGRPRHAQRPTRHRTAELPR